MERREVQNCLSRRDHLTKAQRTKASERLSGRNEKDASLTAVGQGVNEDPRRTPCGKSGAMPRGKNRGQTAQERQTA